MENEQLLGALVIRWKMKVLELTEKVHATNREGFAALLAAGNAFEICASELESVLNKMKTPTPATIDIESAAKEIHARTTNPVPLERIVDILTSHLPKLSESAAKFPEDSWAIVQTQSAIEITNNAASHELVICCIPANPEACKHVGGVGA